jgi:hypothetical protein
MAYFHTNAAVEIGLDNVTIRFPSGRVCWARIVHAERVGGRVTYAMLDRRIHEPHVGYGGYTLSGCFATEVCAPPLEDDEIEEQQVEGDEE